jgi:hypothetical protein
MSNKNHFIITVIKLMTNNPTWGKGLALVSTLPSRMTSSSLRASTVTFVAAYAMKIIPRQATQAALVSLGDAGGNAIRVTTALVPGL